MSPARLSVNNPVLANLVMLAIIVLGVVALMGLPRELMPEINMQWVFIAKPYPGVPPEEIEKLITVPIEDEIRDVEGVQSISSQSADGRSTISVKFDQMSEEEFRSRYQDLRAEVDKVKDLPEDALDTIFLAFTSSDMMPVVAAHLHGQLPLKTLMQLGKDLREQLLDIPNVAKVELTGVRDREVWVEADPVKLEGQALSLEHVRNAIALHGVNVPGGSMPVGRQELFIRTVGEFEEPADVERVIVRSTPMGQTVRVGDVASVHEDFEDERTRSRLNLDPVVTLTVTKRAEGNALNVTDHVRRISEEFVSQHGDNLHVTFTRDSSEPINDILTKLTRNAWIGFGTVVVVLFVVLGMRNAILAALGIPLSFLACFIFMFNSGESFNSNSLFGLVLVLGIVVDDAIIIVENCYRHRQLGKSWKDAAIEGTEEVTAPVFSAIATTIAAFLPLMLLPGIMGKFLRIIPVVVSFALTASLFEALFILPSHFAEWPGRGAKGKRQPRVTPGWLVRVRDAYLVGLRAVIRVRYWAFGLIVAALLAAAGLIPLLGTNMFSGEEVPTFQVRVKMPTGTNLDTTSRILREFEEAALDLPPSEVRSVHSTAGLIITDTDWVFASSIGELWLDLVPSYERTRSLDTIMSDLRARLLEITGPTSIELAKLNTGPPVGKAVEVKLKGRYFDELERAAEELKASLQESAGVLDVDDDFDEGKREVRLKVDPQRAALHGLSVGQVGAAVRNAVDGVTADKMYDADEEIEVVVRLDMTATKRPEDLLRLPLLTPLGTTIALSEVAGYEMASTRGQINRWKNQRSITVSANVDESITSSVEVNAQLAGAFAEMKNRYPGITIDFSGEFKEFQEAFAGIAQLFLVGMLLIYAILGAQFRSYIQPLVIMFTVPFAFIGAIFGLLVSGNPFSIVTMYGVVALAGIAVNDAIVMIAFINSARRDGMSTVDAVVAAGQHRLRPILLTSLTTIAGLLPMALGIGGASLTWSPMANTIVWGLSVATLLTLFMIPAVYVILVEDFAERLRRRLFG